MRTKPLAIDIPNTSISNGPLPYLFGNREDHVKYVVPLYEASIKGDWETAKLIFEKRPDLIRCSLDDNLSTALHVAVASRLYTVKSNFVKNLVHMMTNEELELKNKFSCTAFWIAAASNNMHAVVTMMERNSNLMKIRGYKDVLPATISARRWDQGLASYLYDCSQKMTADYWTDRDRDKTLLYCLESYNYDLALQILEDRPELARNVSLLNILAKDPEGFDKEQKNFISKIIAATVSFCFMNVQPAAEEDSKALQILKKIWEHTTKTMNIDEIEKVLKGPPRPLFVAAETGNTKFIVELLRTYPHLMLSKNDDGLTIFHIAVLHRHHDIYNLLYEIDRRTTHEIFSIKDKSNNNMLHLVGKSSKNMAEKTSGSLLMQREVLWYIYVMLMMPPYIVDLKNDDGQTPYELFSKENELLISKALKWMKDCMVVATLIITVAFAVAFTVPGGYNPKGFPVFLHKPHNHTFLVFVIADAVSLFSATTSLLVFLFILISHHEEQDFLKALPMLVMIGLLSLFISLAALMVTFSASFFVLYHQGLKWVPILIAALATLPVFVFAVLQTPLWVDMFRSTFEDDYLFNSKIRVLYPTKPSLCSNRSPCCHFRLKSNSKLGYR